MMNMISARKLLRNIFMTLTHMLPLLLVFACVHTSQADARTIIVSLSDSRRRMRKVHVVLCKLLSSGEETSQRSLPLHGFTF